MNLVPHFSLTLDLIFLLIIDLWHKVSSLHKWIHNSNQTAQDDIPNAKSEGPELSIEACSQSIVQDSIIKSLKIRKLETGSADVWWADVSDYWASITRKWERVACAWAEFRGAISKMRKHHKLTLPSVANEIVTGAPWNISRHQLSICHFIRSYIWIGWRIMICTVGWKLVQAHCLWPDSTICRMPCNLHAFPRNVDVQINEINGTSLYAFICVCMAKVDLYWCQWKAFYESRKCGLSANYPLYPWALCSEWIAPCQVRHHAWSPLWPLLKWCSSSFEWLWILGSNGSHGISLICCEQPGSPVLGVQLIKWPWLNRCIQVWLQCASDWETSRCSL